jgi:Protein of unknown function (DUF2934)
MSEGNRAFDPRRMATAPIKLSASLFFSYQAAILRLWADHCERLARECDKGLEAFGSWTERARPPAKPSEDLIRTRAQQIWQENGQPSGRVEEFWNQAERECREIKSLQQHIGGKR